ncbi:MAG: hypothetical protein WDM77_15125 [Steroidobacteraceae bacterium]
MELGIRARRTHTLWNGAIECRLLRLTVETGSFREVGQKRTGVIGDEQLAAAPGARMFANRLAKNMKRLDGWARDQGRVQCAAVRCGHAPSTRWRSTAMP